LPAIAAVPRTLVGAITSDDRSGVDEILLLSDVRGRAVVDAAGRPLGSVADLAVDHADAYPRVFAIEVRDTWRSLVRIDAPEVVVGDAVREAAPLGLRLVRDLLDAQVVDIAGRRLARVGEIDLAARAAAPRRCPRRTRSARRWATRRGSTTRSQRLGRSTWPTERSSRSPSR
jgi:sporulation protein YlmC with PRC-barrel domain